MADLNFINYGGLKGSIEKELNRSDLGNQVSGFITLCEAEIRRQVRRRVVRASILLDGESVVLPADCAEVKSLVITAPVPYPPIAIGSKNAVDEFRWRWQGSTGRPRSAAVIGRELVLGPAPDQTYTAELTYYEALRPLSDDNDSNLLLSEAPDLYFYGSLIHSAPFLKDDERLALWEARFDRAVLQLNAVRQREEFGANPKPARLPVVFG